MLRSEQTLNVDWSWLEQVRGSHGRGPPAARRNRHGRRPTAYGTSTTRYSVWCLCRLRLAHTSCVVQGGAVQGGAGGALPGEVQKCAVHCPMWRAVRRLAGRCLASPIGAAHRVRVYQVPGLESPSLCGGPSSIFGADCAGEPRA